MKNSADRGGCCPPRLKTQAPAIAEFNNKLLYYSFKIINSNFKNKLKMLTSANVKFTSKVHLFWEIQQTEVCSGLQIYSKQQMLSIKLTSRCSCCFQRIFHHETSTISAQQFRHFVQTTKTTQPCPQVSSVNGSIRLFTGLEIATDTVAFAT